VLRILFLLHDTPPEKVERSQSDWTTTFEFKISMMRSIVSDLHQTDGPSACVFFRFRFACSLPTGLTQAKGGYITIKYFQSVPLNLQRLDHRMALA
jgi:hypothetical protein